MVIPLTPDAFYEGAREFAGTALEAHLARKYRRVAIDAATALEHLAKACLAARSPALLTEMKNEGSVSSLLRLLGITAREMPPQLRTVSLRNAYDRAKRFVTSSASDRDLQTLFDMRDGTIHAAQNDEVEERLVVAFVQHADALLADLGHDRATFWGAQLDVVDALLADASDKVAHGVAVKLAAARANFERRYGEEPVEVLCLVRRLASPQSLGTGQERAYCPACESPGVASGYKEVEWGYEGDEDVTFRATSGIVFFTAEAFACGVCGLRLDLEAELTAAGMESRWEIEGADPYEPDPGDEDAAYERWRDSRLLERGE